MARGVRLWVAITILACGIIAAANLPLRGTRTGTQGPFVFSRIPQPTPARQRAQRLADEWRAAQTESRLAEERKRLRDRLTKPLQDVDRPVLVMAGGDRDAAALQAQLAAHLDSIWRDLGLAETKIAVGVVIDHVDGTDPSVPREESWGPSYLLPDSTNRTVCLVRLAENAGWRHAVQREAASGATWLREWLKTSLGPCAFLAAYGMPGRSVLGWLSNRSFDLALAPTWNDSLDADRRRTSLMFGGDTRWWWDYLYHQSFPAVACLAGRVAACREAVLAGASEETERRAFSPVVVTSRRFWQQQRLIGATFYLSDVAREIGRDRFLEFWNSSLPVDTSLARALRQPVGEWTARWQRHFAPQLRLGPAAPPGGTLLAVLLAIACVATVTLTARKRQVR